MNRLLLFLLPDRPCTLLACALSLVAFLLGLLEMLDKDFAAAHVHLHLSLGIMAALFVLKFVAMRATYQVAEDAQHQLNHHIKKLRQNPRPKERSEAEQLAQEKAEMAELVGALKQALNNIAPDSPVRPKYEATLELMQRISHRA